MMSSLNKKTFWEALIEYNKIFELEKKLTKEMLEDNLYKPNIPDTLSEEPKGDNTP